MNLTALIIIGLPLPFLGLSTYYLFEQRYHAALIAFFVAAIAALPFFGLFVLFPAI